jgi:CMP-N,N'-diacetyllegionaminic acid synthase
MKIVTILPARGGSKGIIKKNLYPMAGRPLLWYTLNAAKNITFNADIWVSTDDYDIKQFALENGAQVIDRPKEFATDTATTESVLEHFTENVDYDIMVLIQPTSPLVQSMDIDRGLDAVISGYDSAMSVINTNDILFWDKSSGKAVNYNPHERGRRQTRISPFVIENGGFFVTTREQFLESKCRIGGRIFFVETDFWTWPQVDAPEDIKMIEALIKVANART